MSTTRRSLATMAFGLTLGLSALGGTARAQVPQPGVTSTVQRSGLIQRYIPIQPNLPPDPRRDQWYDTRWGDPPNDRKHKNWYPNGGIYGLPWKVTDSRSVYPYFYGAPGRDTITADSKPSHPLMRIPNGFLHPFKPVGMYYDQGSYVPVYDLDPLVPGPGAFPIPFYRRLTNWGG